MSPIRRGTSCSSGSSRPFARGPVGPASTSTSGPRSGRPYRSESSRTVKRTVSALSRQARLLEEAVCEGRLAERADPSVVGDEFRSIVDGMNATMDAFVRPMRVTAGYVDRISRGDIPPKITETYRGDFNAIKESLNRCIETIETLVADANLLLKAAVDV